MLIENHVFTTIPFYIYSAYNLYLIIVCLCQKSRLGALESLRTSNSRSIVVASDVAARGLDIQAVTTVVHYDVARSVDTFIHRAGRTAVSSRYLAVYLVSFFHLICVFS